MATITAREIIDAAALYTLNNAEWCRGAFARDKNYMPIAHSCSTAHSFCMLGAVLRTAIRDYDISERECLRLTALLNSRRHYTAFQLSRYDPQMSLAVWFNDIYAHSKRAVISKLNRIAHSPHTTKVSFYGRRQYVYTPRR